MRLAAAAFVLIFTVHGVHAQTVFRCGSVYSQTPCPQGKVVEATDPRTGAQRVEAGRVAADERRRAAEMRRAPRRSGRVEAGLRRKPQRCTGTPRQARVCCRTPPCKEKAGLVETSLKHPVHSGRPGKPQARQAQHALINCRPLRR